MKKVLITGATGLIGSKLCRLLIERGDELTIFTRSIETGKAAVPNAHNYVAWNYNNFNTWIDYIDGKDAIIHLAGASVMGKRWSPGYKQLIQESREISTKNLVKAIEIVQNKPKVLISSSAVGYYGNTDEQEVDEHSPPGEDFLADVCKAWENEAAKVELVDVRRVSVRTGIVLSKEGGALKKMLTPFKLFAGGSLGSGMQWFPWIHIDDIVNIYLFVLDNEKINGPINAASPNPVRMKDFVNALGKKMNRPAVFNVPGLVLRIVLGEGAESVLSGQRVSPKKLIEAGYKFKFNNLNEALDNLLK